MIDTTATLEAIALTPIAAAKADSSEKAPPRLDRDIKNSIKMHGKIKNFTAIVRRVRDSGRHAHAIFTAVKNVFMLAPVIRLCVLHEALAAVASLRAARI